MTTASPPIASALQNLIQSPSSPTHTAKPTDSNQSHHALALQIAHNLRYQHAWTDVRIHFHHNDSNSSSSSTTTRPSPNLGIRPVLSGRPPTRLYVHPDEQIEFLQRQAKKQSSAKTAGGKSTTTAAAAGGKTATATATAAVKVAPEGLPENQLPPEREWVLPSHLREKWSLRRLATVFDALEQVPSREAGELVFGGEDEGQGVGDGDGEGNGQANREEDPGTSNRWRTEQPKRLLLATLDDDSTVVYYIVHDGIVKPRQN